MSETAPYPAFINDGVYAVVFPGVGLDGMGVYRRTTSAHILGVGVSVGGKIDDEYYLSGEEKITKFTKIIRISLETEEVSPLDK